MEGKPAFLVPAPQTLTNPVSAPSPGSGLKRGHCTEQPQQDRTYLWQRNQRHWVWKGPEEDKCNCVDLFRLKFLNGKKE